MTEAEQLFYDELEDYQGLADAYPVAVLEAYFDNDGTLEHFEDAYQGSYEGFSEEQAIGEYFQDLYSGQANDLPDLFQNHVDWESMANDALHDGMWTGYLGAGEYALFIGI